MRAADTDELQERIEHALWGFTQVYDAEDGRGTEIGVHAPVHKVVAAIFPIITGEVRKGQAEAWDEGYVWGCFDDTDGFSRNPYREESYE